MNLVRIKQDHRKKVYSVPNTTTFTEPIQVLFKIAKVLQGSKNKKKVENNLLSTLARQNVMHYKSGKIPVW